MESNPATRASRWSSLHAMTWVAVLTLGLAQTSALAQSDPYHSDYRSQPGLLSHSNLLSGLQAHIGFSSDGAVPQNAWRASDPTGQLQPSKFTHRQNKPRQPATLIPDILTDDADSELRTSPFELVDYQSPEVSDIESPLTPYGSSTDSPPMQYNTHPELDSAHPFDVPAVEANNEACPTCNENSPVAPAQVFEEESNGWISAGANSTITWLPGGNDDIGLTDIDIFASRMTLKRPRGQWSFDSGMQIHFVDGPTRTDLPARLYNARVSLMYTGQLTQQFGYQVAFTPSIFTDFDNTGSDAWRFIGRAIGFYYISPTTQLVGGLVYLDREDLSVIPAVGVITQPNPDTKIELVMPRPKISYRYRQEENKEQFIYLAGEFGGGSWAIERQNRTDDVATYSDLRAVLGWESKAKKGATSFFEIGYVFNRQLEYKSGIGDFDPGATVMFRSGSRF